MFCQKKYKQIIKLILCTFNPNIKCKECGRGAQTFFYKHK